MSQSNFDDHPELERGHTGYRKGEVIVIGGGAGGRSMITEQLVRKMIAEQGCEAAVCESDIPIEPMPEIPAPTEIERDLKQHWGGTGFKTNKPKKRRLKGSPDHEAQRFHTH